jgi:undecaprenyl-diphosphatase
LNIIEALILGVVQGLTEFIPVSSSGHLVLLQQIFNITEGSLTFTVFVHLGTLIAVFLVFFKDIVAMVRRPLARLPMLIITGAAVTAVFGFLFEDQIRGIFDSGKYLGINFILTGLILWIVDQYRRGYKTLTDMSFLDAGFIGLLQAVAMLPAISRSGMTIAAGLIRRMDRREAARFSFLLSIPVILGTGLLEGMSLLESGFESIPLTPVIIGTAAAAVTGYFAIQYMLNVLTKGSLKIFSYYVIALGILVLVDQFFLHIFMPPLI